MAADASASDFGRYRLGRLLGRGGMGEVYLAHDRRSIATSPSSLSRPTTSATRRPAGGCCTRPTRPRPSTIPASAPSTKPAARLKAMPSSSCSTSRASRFGHVAGGSAARAGRAAHRRRHRRGFGRAHRRGIVHRDLKPSNVMVTPSGRPKLLDFGIAKQVVLPPSAVNAPTSSGGFTTAGTIIGTPAYMSPEQIQQRPLDGRSDLFSLGVLLFESLTGRCAFEGPSTLESIANVLHVHPPAPSSLRADLNERHDELCGKLLAKDAADRFQSADELVGAIRVLTETSRTDLSGGLPKPPERGRWCLVGWSSPPPRSSSLTTVARWCGSGHRLCRACRPRLTSGTSAACRRCVTARTETGRPAVSNRRSALPAHVLACTRLADAYAELDDDRPRRSSC